MKRKTKKDGSRAPRPGAGTVERLKPERVQGGLAVRRMRERVRVMERLDGMAGWQLAPDGRTIRRTRQFEDPKDAAAFSAFAVQLAAGRGQPLSITLAEGQLAVTLRGRTRHGITGTLLDLAAELG